MDHDTALALIRRIDLNNILAQTDRLTETDVTSRRDLEAKADAEDVRRSKAIYALIPDDVLLSMKAN